MTTATATAPRLFDTKYGKAISIINGEIDTTTIEETERYKKVNIYNNYTITSSKDKQKIIDKLKRFDSLLNKENGEWKNDINDTSNYNQEEINKIIQLHADYDNIMFILKNPKEKFEFIKESQANIKKYPELNQLLITLKNIKIKYNFLFYNFFQNYIN